MSESNTSTGHTDVQVVYIILPLLPWLNLPAIIAVCRTQEQAEKIIERYPPWSVQVFEHRLDIEEEVAQTC